MSILTAIFQAIGQAIAFILPISENGHSSIFHDFSARYSGSCSELTGLIHIGIAIGLLVAFYKVFIKLSADFFGSIKDIFKKQFSVKNAKPSRKFMLLTMIPLAIMILYVIPTGSGRNLYDLIQSVGYNKTLLDEGICFIITAVFLFLASGKLKKDVNGKAMDLTTVIVLGFASFAALPIGGLSLSAAILSISILFGVNKKVSARYFISISVPILVVLGIVEIVKCVTYVSIISGIIAVVISAAVSFFLGKLLIYIVNNNKLYAFSYYDFTLGLICVIAGIIELIVR